MMTAQLFFVIWATGFVVTLALQQLSEKNSRSMPSRMFGASLWFIILPVSIYLVGKDKGWWTFK